MVAANKTLKGVALAGGVKLTLVSVLESGLTVGASIDGPIGVCSLYPALTRGPPLMCWALPRG